MKPSTQLKHDDARREKIKKCWKLRLQGKNYRDIAEEMGIGLGSVHEYLREMREAIEKLNLERAKEEKELDLERIDLAMQACMDRVTAGTHNNRDIETLIKVSERRAKMLGYDAPTTSKTELSGPDGAPLQLSAGDWQTRMIAAGWTPPAEAQVLPGLPQPQQLNQRNDDGFEIEAIEVKE